MSYLHCPTCRCAYNVATEPVCPRCEVAPGAPADPAEAIVAAAEQLARAVSRASAEQVAKAKSMLADSPVVRALRATLSLSAPSDASIASASSARLAAAIEPTVPAHQALLTSVALALVTRMAAARNDVTAPIARADRLRSWAKARLAAPMQRARALFDRAA